LATAHLYHSELFIHEQSEYEKDKNVILSFSSFSMENAIENGSTSLCCGSSETPELPLYHSELFIHVIVEHGCSVYDPKDGTIRVRKR